MKKLFASLLFCSALSAWAVILEWDANPGNLAGYRVYSGRQSRVYDTVLDVGNVSNWTSATPPGTTYYAVTAYDEDGFENEFSNEVSYTGAPQFTLLGNQLSWTPDSRADLLRYEILSGWSPDTTDGTQFLEPQHLRMRLLQNPARKWYKIRSRYLDGSASEYSPQVSWAAASADEPKAAPPRMLRYPLPVGHWFIESSDDLLNPLGWLPFAESDGDFEIVIDTSVPKRYFRAYKKL